MRLASLTLLLLAAATIAGCGGSDETTSRPADRGSASAREVRQAWERERACRRPAGASRWGCSVGPYRCQGVVTGRGWSVSCAKPGRSIGFIVRRG